MALLSHASKVILKILQARLQRYINHELDQTASICRIIEKAREFQKIIYFCFIEYAKAFDWVDHNKLWKILQEMGIPDHLPASWKMWMQVKKQQLELDMNWNNRLVPNQETSTSRLSIVSLLI